MSEGPQQEPFSSTRSARFIAVVGDHRLQIALMACAIPIGVAHTFLGFQSNWTFLPSPGDPPESPNAWWEAGFGILTVCFAIVVIGHANHVRKPFVSKWALVVMGCVAASFVYRHMLVVERRPYVEAERLELEQMEEKRRFSPEKVQFVPYEVVGLPKLYDVEPLWMSGDGVGHAATTAYIERFQGDTVVWLADFNQLVLPDKDPCKSQTCVRVGLLDDGREIVRYQLHYFKFYEVRLADSVLQLRTADTEGLPSDDVVEVFEHAKPMVIK